MTDSLRALMLGILLFSVSNDVEASPPEPQPAVYSSKMASAPLLFTENRGQVADMRGRLRPDILFTAHSRGAKIFLTAAGIHYQFTRVVYPKGFEQDERKVQDHAKQEKLRRKIKTSTHRFTLSLVGANPHPKIRKEEQNIYTENFYLAHCREGITGVHTYGRVVMEEVYPGIDWVVYSNGQGMKYDLVVHPGADPELIRLKVSDADKTEVSEDGELVIKSSLGTVREAPPIAFCNGARVPACFTKKGAYIRLAIGEYQKDKTLIIDPEISWATYYGGAGDDRAYSCRADKLGNVYLTGSTSSLSGIATNGGFQGNLLGSVNAFTVKFSATGARLWGTYMGDGSTQAYFGATDSIGNIYLTGQTSASNFPVTAAAHDLNHNGGIDAFLMKLGSSGMIAMSTYYGGSGDDIGLSCRVDRCGYVSLSGYTTSLNSGAIATAGAFQTTLQSSGSTFLAKFNSFGVRQWGTYYGAGSNSSYFVTTDDSCNIYIGGTTSATSNVASTNSHQSTYGGGSSDGFLAKFNGAGARVWATYYGGAGDDQATACSIDSIGNVFLMGHTNSTSAIASGGFQNTLSSGSVDAYLVKFNSVGVRQWATYYGGTSSDTGRSCVTDKFGNVYLAGTTSSANGIASGGFQSNLAGLTDAFLVKFSSSGSRLWGTYYGGAGGDWGTSCATDSSGNVLLAGYTNSSTGISQNGFQNTFAGATDAFLAKIIDCADISVTQHNDTLVANATNANYQWLSCGNAYSPISGATNQIFIPDTTGSYAVAVTQNACTDTSVCYAVVICQPTDSLIKDTACNSYTLNGQVYDSSGTYTQHFINSDGCDSTLTLDLLVRRTDTSVFQNPITQNCGDGDIEYVEAVLANAQNRQRRDYHFYQVETVICDADSLHGSRGCTVAEVWNFMKSKLCYQVPRYEDFPALTGAFCLRDFNSEIATPFRWILRTIFEQMPESSPTDLNPPVSNCAYVQLSPTPARLLAGAIMKAKFIPIPGPEGRLIIIRLPPDCNSNIITEPVKLVVDEQNYRMINYTLDGHFLYPGKVERYVIEDCGKIKVVTRGMGFTTCGSNWWGANIALLNKCTGQFTFNNVSERLKTDFNR